MTLSPRIRFFNLFRNFFRMPALEYWLARLTEGKGYDNFFVKCLPQNYQYGKNSLRIAKRDGIRYRLDISEYMEWVIYFGLRVEERDGLYPLVKPNMVILDIGTNIGETLLNFARLTGPGGMVYGFEPVEENFRKCMLNISMNDFNQIRMNQVALSDKNEQLYFGSSSNSNSGGIFMQKEKNESAKMVEALTLDDFIAGINAGAIHFIKIDVEGFELNVLKGAVNTIRKFRPLLFVEIDEDNLKRQQVTHREVESLIRSLGYEIRVAGEKKITEGSNLHYDIICEPIKTEF
jgi:FkbM family methyltransferase